MALDVLVQRRHDKRAAKRLLRKLPTRRRERQMKRFKSAGQVQRFLYAHDQVNNLFHLRRDYVSASEHRAARTRAFEVWAEITEASVVA